ncbi:MAG TPA: hypothetical protein VMW80_06885 [Candidatus Dormibacteraeota bacterium]|nr:hypothetical protein [Candidatus Dormibacteraeota bacterium]
MASTYRTPAQRRAALPYGHTPMSATELSTTLDIVDTLSPPDLRRRTSSMVALARGAGATAADMRYLSGEDVSTIADAGTWVSFRRPGFERTVPVSCQFGPDLYRLARQVRSRSLIGDRGQTTPLPASCPQELAETLQTEVTKDHPDLLVTIERLRRAWLVDQLSGALPVRDFLDLTGERSWQTAHDLVDFCPTSSLEPTQLARLTGGVDDLELIDLETWGLD